MKYLHRSKTDRVIFGVCGGLGEYFSLDPVIFRLLFVLLTLLGGGGIVIYIIAALVMPSDSELADDSNNTGIKFKNRVHGLASELKSKSEKDGAKNSWLGWVVVFVGVALLVNELLPKHVINWSIILAVIVIAFGVRLMKHDFKIKHETKKASPLEASDSGEKVSAKEEDEKKDEVRPLHTKEVVREVHHHHHRSSGVFGLLFGLLIVVLGFIFLAQNLGLVSGIDISYIAKFWPVFIIIAGLSLLSRGTWLGSLLAFLITLGIIVVLVTTYIFPNEQGELTVEEFSITNTNNVSKLDVYIKGGAGSLLVNSGSVGSVTGHFESNVTTLSITTSTENSTDKIRIETQGSIKRLGGKFINSLDVALTEGLPLNLSVDAGASKIDIDTSKVKLQNLELQSGASSIKLKLGDILASSTVRVSAGASSIDISYPKDVGMRITANTGLSSKNFFDFKQVDEDIYESMNYATELKKIELVLEAGVSSMSIRSY